VAAAAAGLVNNADSALVDGQVYLSADAAIWRVADRRRRQMACFAARDATCLHEGEQWKWRRGSMSSHVVFLLRTA